MSDRTPLALARRAGGDVRFTWADGLEAADLVDAVTRPTGVRDAASLVETSYDL